MDSAQNKIADLQGRIQMQRRMIEGFQTICAATPNPEVIRQAESSIRDSRNTIAYLEENLNALQERVAPISAPRAESYPIDSSAAYRSGPYSRYSLSLIHI